MNHDDASLQPRLAPFLPDAKPNIYPARRHLRFLNKMCRLYTTTTNMVPETALTDVLASFTTATDAAVIGLPSSDSLIPPENGITLLDTKNEIFLAYLQALALRNLHVIRSVRDGGDAEKAHARSIEMTRKLVEHRVYLERGVRPLEQKIKYQVDKAVKAADDAERGALQKVQSNGRVNTKPAAGDEDDSEDPDSDEAAELSYRPRAATLAQGPAAAPQQGRREKSKEDGVYRPPRITATAMPTTESRERKERSRPARSGTVDEYINNELSTAPRAEPSIGSTITDRGRKTKDTRQLAKEQERRDYEETNLVRLPKESDKAKKGGRGERGGAFGGDEWRGLGESVNRIGDLTRKKGKDSVLDRSRKRKAAEDGPRGSGIGEAFDVKRKRMEKKSRR